MPTRWNPDWPESRKAEEREKRRKKYALGRLQAGEKYTRRDTVVRKPELPEPSVETLEVLRSAIRRKLEG